VAVRRRPDGPAGQVVVVELRNLLGVKVVQLLDGLLAGRPIAAERVERGLGVAHGANGALILRVPQPAIAALSGGLDEGVGNSGGGHGGW